MYFAHINALAINWGNTHFVSTADVLVRGVFFPIIAVIMGIVIYRTIKDFKEDWSNMAEFDDEEEDNLDDFDLVFEDKSKTKDEEVCSEKTVVYKSTLTLWKEQGLLLSVLSVLPGALLTGTGIYMICAGGDKVLAAFGIMFIVTSTIATWLAPNVWASFDKED